MRVFGIGLHKTGLSTLTECFTILGYRVCPQAESYAVREVTAQGKYVPCLRVASKYEVMVDSPWNYVDLYEVLDKVFPNSRFILTHRQEEEWFRSLLRWVRRNDSGGWIDMHATLAGEFRVERREELLEAYRQHALGVQDYFANRSEPVAGGKLLVLNWEVNGWRELCQFLGKEVPVQWDDTELPLPHMLQYNPLTGGYIDISPRFGTRARP